MKIDEALDALNDIETITAHRYGGSVFISASCSEDWANQWFLSFKEKETSVENTYNFWWKAYDVSISDMLRVMEIVNKLIKTPVDDRFATKKYEVAPKGLVSANGQQLLSMDCWGNVFFAAKNNRLKQKFSFHEVNDILDKFFDDKTKANWMSRIVRMYCKQEGQ